MIKAAEHVIFDKVLSKSLIKGLCVMDIFPVLFCEMICCCSWWTLPKHSIFICGNEKAWKNNHDEEHYNTNNNINIHSNKYVISFVMQN